MAMVIPSTIIGLLQCFIICHIQSPLGAVKWLMNDFNRYGLVTNAFT